MQPFYLAEIVTQDKLIHQGIFFPPSSVNRRTSAGKVNRAILWVHGLSSTFYGNVKLLEEFAQQCEEFGIGFALFNNRGHDLIAGLKKIDKRKLKGHSHKMGGAGYEVFTESNYDITAGVAFLVQQGFSEIVIAGHSTGANKVCYYAATKKDPRVIGIILAGPMSDRLDQTLNSEKLKKNLKFMKKLVKEEKGNEPLMGYNFFPITPKRFLSLFSPNSAEDVFDYGEPKPQMTTFQKIKKPLLVVLSEKDEYADRPMTKIKEVFDRHQRSINYKSSIIPEALHSFNGMEKQFAEIVFDWVKNL